MRRAVALTFAVAMGCVSAQQPEMEAKQEARLADIFRAYDGAVPGASVAVIRDGKTIVSRSFGLADVGAGTQASPATNYRLASVTKQFTAMAILILADRGKLSLDAALTSLFPEFPSYGSSITVRHLLTHTSGLVDYEDVMPDSMKIPLKDFDVLHLLLAQPRTDFAPGTKYHYSNSGYALLALIVERVSGKTFARFLHDEIFVPAGMRGTLAYERGISSVSHRAYGHSRDGDGWPQTDQSLTSAVLGDGGVYSSIDDMAKWIAAIDANRLAVDASQAVVATDRGAHYGYGWFVGARRGHRAIWHTGETMGFRNALVRLPDERLSVIVLTNRNEGEPIELALDVAGFVLAK
jgi:CubicO group peptidase (beta-lactamase class C family)